MHQQSVLQWENLPSGWKINPDRYQTTQGSIEFLNSGHPYDYAHELSTMRTAHWKLHLALPDNRNDPVVKEIANHLLQRTDLYSFKIGVGDDDFLQNNLTSNKGITIYVGSRFAAEKLGKELSEKFGPLLKPFERGVRCEMRDQYVAPGISMRFDATKHIFATQNDGSSIHYTQYGAAGISGFEQRPRSQTAVDPNKIFVTIPNGKYPFIESSNPGNKRVAQNYAKYVIDQLIDEFGDYFLGQSATETYVASNRNVQALPSWTKDWAEAQWGKLSTVPQEDLGQAALKAKAANIWERF